ncbi:MAG: hypothetical protein IAE77_16315 [Prosthecobacter sp.]|uniref:hypothetical protein n=1 Tax=Prosthecobacter sp. TaxID=1965333 RepID=UPI001A0C3005|nr:hypothetical protein [Prosthecobacter sp.]MBE2285027.1 hypothetical protein [Prosthecobacter sp.]
MSPYVALNPFAVTSVGENDLWNAASLLDVPDIHSAAFCVLKNTVDQVRLQKRSQVRFVRGAGGSGKSHLFARLHRVCADGIFYAYAPNPPLQPEALEQFVLSRFVTSLRHPARTAEGKAPYSQLRLLAYALLKPVVEQNFTFPELHEAWAEISLDTRKEMIHQAVQILENDHPMVPRSVLRCLLTVLREDKEHLAAQWLSGAAYLTESELKYLGVTEPLQRGEMGPVIQLFGKLASQAGSPVVLALDQLDLIATPPQFDEMQRLLFSLIDQSENWVVLIGVVAERFAMWDAALTQALRGRIGVPDAYAPLGFRLPVIDMLPIGSEQKRQLLACRLDAPALAEQRKKDGVSSAIHPLLEEDIARLTAGGAIFPRHLLAAAAEVYASRVSDVMPGLQPAVAATPEAVVNAVPPATQTAAPAPVVAAPAVAVPIPVPTPVPEAAASAAVPVVPVVEAVAPKPAPPPPSIPVTETVVVPTPVVAPKAVTPPPAASEPAAAVVVAAAVAAPVIAPVIVSKMPLAEKMDALLKEAMEAAKGDTAAPSAVDLGERARDVIELMVAPPVTITEGDLRKTYDNFDGTDRWFEWGGGRVRLVTSNSMRGSFIAVLERLKEAAGDTLLLRHAVAPVSGQLTLELLNAFKARNTFHHLPASETVVLAALGRLLAAQREGSYDELATEPPASRDHVLAALRSHPLLRGLRLWDMIQKAHAPKASRAPAPPPPPSSVLSTIARSKPGSPPSPAAPAIPAVPAMVVTVPPPSLPGATPAPPPLPVAKPAPPPVPVAKPPMPPITAVPTAQKPVARPPAPPVAKPPPGVPRPPVARKLPPPSTENAA